MKNKEYVQSDAALQSMLDYFSKQPFIALDTEFHRERTYFPQIALLQISNGERTCCIDPLAIRDLSPLGALLVSTGICKVLHSASQDLEVFANLLGVMPSPLFDTQIGAAFLGLGEQLSYAALVQHFCHCELDKAHTRSNWLQRPLSEEQLDYAADDVFYLAQIYPMMHAALEQGGRLDWMLQECASRIHLQDYLPKPEECWKKVKGKDRLKGPSIAALKTLSQWREQVAIEKDRPRRFILTDEILLEIARLMPSTAEDLGKISGLDAPFLRTQSEPLLAAVANAREMPQALWPVLKGYHKKTTEERSLLDALTKLVQHYAERSGLAQSLLATRSDLESILDGETKSSLLSDWRRSLAGDWVLKFLQGEGAAAVLRGEQGAEAAVHQFLATIGESA